MDNSLPNPKPFNPPASSPLPNTNPYNTEIPPESIEHTPERPNPLASSSGRVESPSYQEPPSADQVQSNDLPHRPHHFITKKALILGLLFIVTAALSSIVTFALVGSRAEKAPEAKQAQLPIPTVTQIKEYANETLGLSLSHPDAWTVSELPSTDGVTTTLSLQKDPTFVLKIMLGPAGVGGRCISDPTVEVGSDAVSAFGKPLNIFFEGDSTTSTVRQGYVIAGDVPCANIAFIDIADITQALPGTPGVALAQVSFTDSTQPTLASLLESDNYKEAKAIIESLMIKSPVSDLNQPSNSDSMTACTLDAKVCADGSSVGRVPPSCEFAACP